MSWVDGEPFARIIDSESATSSLRPLLGMHFGYRVGPDSRRICVGHRPFRGGRSDTPIKDYVDCRQRPLPGKRTCRPCAIVEATFASNLHHAHTREDVGLDPDMAAHLRQPNLLYLAAFRDGSVKVGTSTERRVNTRLTEQGAWMARVVAWVSDGVTVRLLEDWITEKLGLPQSVSIGRKLEGLERPLSDERLRKMLDANKDTVHRLIGSDPLIGSDESAELVRPLDDHWRHPRADAGDWSRLHRYPIDLRTGAHDLDVLNACGRLIAVTRPGSSDQFVADLQPLYGIELELGDFGSEPLAVQDSLF